MNQNALTLRADGPPCTLHIACADFVDAALASAPVVSLNAPWTHFSVRVAGSWIAAAGLLMLGWSLRALGG